jgi:hypothetical protein
MVCANGMWRARRTCVHQKSPHPPLNRWAPAGPAPLYTIRRFVNENRRLPGIRIDRFSAPLRPPCTAPRAQGTGGPRPRRPQPLGHSLHRAQGTGHSPRHSLRNDHSACCDRGPRRPQPAQGTGHRGPQPAQGGRGHRAQAAAPCTGHRGAEGTAPRAQGTGGRSLGHSLHSLHSTAPRAQGGRGLRYGILRGILRGIPRGLTVPSLGRGCGPPTIGLGRFSPNPENFSVGG